MEELREKRKEREEYLNELSERYIECMFFENFSINHIPCFRIFFVGLI